MLNRINPLDMKPATVRYLDSDFQVLTPGSFVICAITSKQIPLDELKYWSWTRQEAYVDAQASLEAEKAAGTLL